MGEIGKENKKEQRLDVEVQGKIIPKDPKEA